MLLVKTKLAVSNTHGIGLFADQFIPKGTVTWEYNPLFDSSFTDEEVAALPDIPRKIFLHYAYFDKVLNKHVLCSDDQRFINHSSHHENVESTTRKDVAARDIQPGEEILCNYNKFDDTYFGRINLPQENLK